MELFCRFIETVFLKKGNHLQRYILTLEELEKKYPTSEKIKKDLRLAKLGLKGEEEIEYELSHANLGLYVLHDITLQYEDLKAQIDYVVVSRGKVYLIECKNLLGNITINERGEFIRETDKKREGIYSPLRQAQRHVEVLKKIWMAKSSMLDRFLVKEKFDQWYVPLVVVANPASILQMKYAPKYVRDKVVRADELTHYIQTDLAHTDRSLLSS